MTMGIWKFIPENLLVYLINYESQLVRDQTGYENKIMDKILQVFLIE